MQLDKAKINKFLGVILGIIIAAFGFVLILQVSSSLLGSSKSICNKRICLARYLEGPPAFNDVALTNHLRKNYFTPGASSQYKLSGFDGRDQHFTEVMDYVKKFFKGKRGGTFVELGAGDGEYKSYSLDLEKDYDWRGLLIEPNMGLYNRLLKKGRKADSTRNCISPYGYPSKIKFSHPEVEQLSEEDTIRTLGETKLNQLWEKKKDTKYTVFESQCVPLENLVYAAGIKDNIDVLILSMSGTDLDVLLNVRFDHLPEIEMVLVIANGVDVNQDVGGYFLERNIIVNKVIGQDPKTATYILTKFVQDVGL